MPALYHWQHADCLKNYSEGDIIVMADSVDEARKKVRDQIDTFLKSELRNWWWWSGPAVAPDYVDEYKEFIRKLEEDLSQEPDLIEHQVIFIRGSE